MKSKPKPRGLIACNSLIQLAFKTSFLIVLIMSVSLSAQGQVFSTPRNISGSSSAQGHQFQTDHDGNIYVVWQDRSSYGADIYFSKSTDGGFNFSYPVNISRTPIYSEYPKIAVDGRENIYVTWDNAGRLKFSYSHDGGISFSFPKTLSEGEWYYFSKIAIDSDGNINIIFRGGMNHRTYFCRSTDGGESVSAPILLAIQSGSPDIAVDSQGKIYIVWVEAGKVWFTYSSDGVTFTTPIILNTGPGNSPGGAKIAADDLGNINVTWQEFFPHETPSYSIDVTFTRSINGGLSFSPPINISNSIYQSSHHQIALDNQGNIYVVWWERSEIYFSHSTNGEDFSIPVNVSNTPNPGEQPEIAVDAQANINIVWMEVLEANGTANFFSRSIDEGMNFSESKQLSLGRHARIATDIKGNIYITYTSSGDIYFIRSIDSLFEDLIDLIEEINLNNGISNSLDAKLDVALRALEDANENNNVAAIRALESFISQVEQQRGNQITNEDADALIAAARKILIMLR